MLTVIIMMNETKRFCNMETICQYFGVSAAIKDRPPQQYVFRAYCQFCTPEKFIEKSVGLKESPHYVETPEWCPLRSANEED